jgi:hypothetical protein
VTVEIAAACEALKLDSWLVVNATPCEVVRAPTVAVVSV